MPVALQEKTVSLDWGKAKRARDEDADFKAFRTYVRMASQLGREIGVISNPSLKHASALIEALIDKADTSVDILCDYLDDLAYGTPAVIDATRRFVNERNGRLRIVLRQRVPYANSKYLSGLDNAGIIATTDLRVVSARMERIYTFHFLLADRRHYRLQAHKDCESAYGMFDAPAEETNALARVFETIHAEAEPYPPR